MTSNQEWSNWRGEILVSKRSTIISIDISIADKADNEFVRHPIQTKLLQDTSITETTRTAQLVLQTYFSKYHKTEDKEWNVL